MSKALDLSNQTFGKLTVIQRASKRNDKYTRWICQCECGNQVEVRTDYLRNGHTKSCGCEKNKYFHKLNLTGQKFGRLTVIGDSGVDSKKCICDCGNEIIVKTYNLTNGNTKSCGCLQREKASEQMHISLIGKKFGKLQVIERVENNRFNHICYKCKCDCGGEVIVDASNLRQGRTNSCGCLKSKGEMLINIWLKEKNINFKNQYSHSNLIFSSGRAQVFDFAIFDDNNKLLFLIEYDGIQHFKDTGGWNDEENLEKIRKRDEEKDMLCKKENIKLYRIKYNESLYKKLTEIMVLENIITPDIEEAEAEAELSE